MEERREKQERYDIARKEKARGKEKSWEMIRMYRAYIKEHEGEWMTRRVTQVEEKKKSEEEEDKNIRFSKIKAKKSEMREKRDGEK